MGGGDTNYIVGLTSKHSTGLGTKLRESWRAAQGVRYQTAMGILTRSPWLNAAVLNFSPEDENIDSMRLRVPGAKVLPVVCAYALNSSSGIPSGWCPGRDSGWGLGDFITHMGNDGETLRG